MKYNQKVFNNSEVNNREQIAVEKKQLKFDQNSSLKQNVITKKQTKANCVMLALQIKSRLKSKTDAIMLL